MDKFINDNTITLGRRRFVGQFVGEGEFDLTLFHYYPLLKIKKFIQEKTTSRFLNDYYFLICLEKRWILAKEVSSLPPLAGSVDLEDFFYFDVDFPSGAIEESIYKSGDLFGDEREHKVWRFSQSDIYQLKSCGKINLFSIFFKNGIDFLRSTMLKEHLKLNS